VTHRYTLLLRGTVIPGHDQPAVAAVAWADDTVIALGSGDDVRSMSRGDSQVIDLEGASVVPLGDGLDAIWPVDATLEVGGRADLAVLESDPRQPDATIRQRLQALALVRGGRVVAGRLPGGRNGGHDPSGREAG